MKRNFHYILLTSLLILSCQNPESQAEENDYKFQNGDLNSTFKKEETINTSSESQFENDESERKLKIQKDSLIAEGWEETDIQNGELPSCYNFLPKKGKSENYLEVHVGGGTDVSIKLMNIKTDKCVRFVFINSNTSYKITHIPEDKYYLKIAYGKNWLSKILNEQCIGKFIRNPMYKKGEDVLDFNNQYNTNGYSIPSYRLSLDVIADERNDACASENINEEEFNK